MKTTALVAGLIIQWVVALIGDMTSQPKSTTPDLDLVELQNRLRK